MFEEIYKVYGENLPSEDIYGASKDSPVTINAIRRKYRRWEPFYQEYVTFCIAKRNEQVKVVTKNEAKKGE